MKKGLFFLLIVFCMFSVSCRRDGKTKNLEPDRDINVVAFICVPQEIDECLPLQILHTHNGWVAHYGGTGVRDSIELIPTRHKYDDGREEIAFDEYVDGVKSGYYYFRAAWNDEESENVLYYQKKCSKKLVQFYCTKICGEGKLSRKHKRTDRNFKYQRWRYGCYRALLRAIKNPRGTLRRGVRFNNGGKSAQSVASPNGKVRISVTAASENEDGKFSVFIILQYDDGSGVTTLCNFASTFFPYYSWTQV